MTIAELVEKLRRNEQTLHDDAFRLACKNCRHRQTWARDPASTECHLNGPTIGEHGMATWPKVRPEEWCSQFDPTDETIARRQLIVERNREREDAEKWRAQPK